VVLGWRCLLELTVDSELSPREQIRQQKIADAWEHLNAEVREHAGHSESMGLAAEAGGFILRHPVFLRRL
jgi:hypothetical protein